MVTGASVVVLPFESQGALGVVSGINGERIISNFLMVNYSVENAQ